MNRNTTDVRVRDLSGWRTVSAWLDSRGSAQTREHYSDAIIQWWRWALENRLKNDPTITPFLAAGETDPTPDALIRHRLSEVKNETLERYHCEDLIESYWHWLKKRKPNPVSDGTALQYISIIRSYFKFATRNGGLDLSRLKFGKIRARYKYVPSQEDLVKLHRHSSPLTWVLIACMKDSGLGPSQLAATKWGQIERREDKHWLVSGQRQKTGEPFTTFFGPDAVNAIEAAYYVNGLAPATDGRAPIFLNEYKETFTGNAVAQRIKRAIISAGFHRIVRGEVIEEFSAYSLRVFFNTALERARTPENWRKRMMGHTLGAVQGAYSRPDLETILAEYKKAYKELSVEPVANEGMSADDLATFERAKGGDAIAIARILEKFGQEHELSKQLKQIIDASKKEQIPADASTSRKPKVGEVLRITEEEATNHLNHGWKLLTVLPSGQLLVQYDGEKQ